ncbi:MAG: ABC transporter permease [Acidobacteriota bacterium]|nr:ABC transporter permease [Acidobacteriota bacterium]
MTVLDMAPAESAPPPDPPTTPRRPGPRSFRRLALAVGAYLGAVVIFSAFVAAKHQNPVTVWRAMIHSTLLQGSSLQEIAMRAVPISLAALAVAVPARAGLVNVGGEGQLILGAVAATGIGVAIGADVPGPLAWLLMAGGGAAAGAAWAGLAGALRAWLGANEAVTTLLLNFVANDIMLYLIYQPWKDPHGSGQPQSRPLPHHAQLPGLFASQVNTSVVVALVAAAAIWWLLRRSHWGFALRVVGGNGEAARRCGLPVSKLMIQSMLVGGALAGLGGMLNLAGLELRLRPDITLTFGYVAFLASWLGRHHPVKVVGAAVLFSAIALSGNGVQLSTGLDGATVDVLLALIVAAPLFLTKFRAAAQ